MSQRVVFKITGRSLNCLSWVAPSDRDAENYYLNYKYHLGGVANLVTGIITQIEFLVLPLDSERASGEMTQEG